jgi:predicted ABC-type ATPase
LHDIPEEVIERRYVKGIKNLFNIYLPIVDQALIFDNSEGNHILMAEMSFTDNLTIYNHKRYNELKNYL